MLQLDAERTQVHRVGSLAYMSPEQLDGSTLDCGADIYSLAAVLYHLIAGRPPFEGPTQPALMHQVFNEDAGAADRPARRRAGRPGRTDPQRAGQAARRPPGELGRFAQGLSGLVARREMPRGRLQGVLDSERFNLLRALEFFADFGDVELWEVVHRAKWQRFVFGHALYKKGQAGGSFHILAQGEVEVFRDGRKVAQLGRGTSVGEMAYLAPSEELRQHRADVIVAAPCTTVSFTPETLVSSRPAHAIASTTPSSRCWCAGCTPRTKRWTIRAASSERIGPRCAVHAARRPRVAAIGGEGIVCSNPARQSCPMTEYEGASR